MMLPLHLILYDNPTNLDNIFQPSRWFCYIAKKTYHSIVESEDADIPSVVYVTPSDDRFGIVFDPNSG